MAFSRSNSTSTPPDLGNFSHISPEKEAKLKEIFQGKVVLVTGATGSFGRKMISNLVKRYNCKKIIVFSRDELKQSEMKSAAARDPALHKNLRYFLGDVRDYDRLLEAFNGVDYIIHAAALKQVDTIEYNPFEAIKTNVLGAQNIVRAAVARKVQRIIALSTDKAANPINLYGASKLCSDKLFVAGNAMGTESGTKCCVVRYGNVFGSRGSIVPVFLRLKKQGVIPITDERMTRFTISLQQAVNFVFNSFLWMKGGEVFVPKIPSYRIRTVAEAIAPNCPIKIIGIRPGEKLHEVMVPEDEARLTIEYDDHFTIQPDFHWWQKEGPESGGKQCPPGFSYSSGQNSEWVSKKQLLPLIKQYCMDYGIDDECLHDTEPHDRATDKLALDDGPKVRHAMLPYARQSIDDVDVQSVVTTMKSAYLTTGPRVEEFESIVAEYIGAKHCVAVSNGTAALHVAVAAAGVGPGDEVIVPAMTFCATANAVQFCGGVPVFADIIGDTMLIDPASVKALITPKTKAIISVDYTGQPVDYDALRAIAKEHKLMLISDAAHAIGSEYHGVKVGAVADLTTFSFHPAKTVTTAEGGIISTNDAELARKMRAFRNHGLSMTHTEREKAGTFFYGMESLGYNYRLPDMLCALGSTQMRHLPEWVARRNAIAEQYDAAFDKMPEVSRIKLAPNVKSSYHIYIVQFDLAKLSVDRDQLYKALRAENIGVNVHYVPVPQHPHYVTSLKAGTARTGPTPVTDKVYPTMLTLPVFPLMTDDDVDDVILAVRKVLNAYRK